MRTIKEIKGSLRQAEEMQQRYEDMTPNDQNAQGLEIWTSAVERYKTELKNHLDTIKTREAKNAVRRERHSILTDGLGLKRVKGALGGVYYE